MTTLQELINARMKEIINIDDFKVKAIKSVVKNTFGIYCPNCGSDNVHEDIKQLRAGDEQADHIYKCLNCGNTGKNNFLTHPPKEMKKK